MAITYDQPRPAHVHVPPVPALIQPSRRTRRPTTDDLNQRPRTAPAPATPLAQPSPRRRPNADQPPGTPAKGPVQYDPNADTFSPTKPVLPLAEDPRLSRPRRAVLAEDPRTDLERDGI